MAEAAAEKPKAKALEKYVSPLALKGKPKLETHAPKFLVRLKALQSRVDTDTASVEDERDGTVDEGRAAAFAEKMRAGAKFPAVKGVRCLDAPGHKDESVIVLFDGMHTHRGAELAKLPEMDVAVWEGTYAQAVFAAASVANREHEDSGRALSSKDKAHAVGMAARAYTMSDTPKKDWPSNRQLAEIDLRGSVSRNLVNQIDPFDRAGGDKRAEANEKKKRSYAGGNRGGAADKAAPFHPNGTPPDADPNPPPVRDAVNGMPANFEVLKGKDVLAHYFEKSPAAALERFLLENHKAKKDDLVVSEIKKSAAPKAGSVAAGPNFDWAHMEMSVGWVSRAMPVLSEMYSLKADKAHAEAEKQLEGLCRYLQELRKSKQAKK